MAGLQGWANYRAPNLRLLIVGLIHLALCYVCLIIGLGILNEHIDDLKHNPSVKHLGTDYPSVRESPVPCGLPTPDMIHILTALGQYNDATQFLQADYTRWHKQLDTALCGLNYEEWVQADPDASNPVFNTARFTYMIASAMDRSDLQPDQESNDNFQTAKGNLDTAMCDIKEKTRFYSKRQLRIHGELRERIARAYITASPAFFRYQQSFIDSGVDAAAKAAMIATMVDENDVEGGFEPTEFGCLDGVPPAKLPFREVDSDGGDDACINHELIRNVLSKAGSVDSLKRLVGANTETLPDAQEMLVALIALSIIGHTDRTLNGGKCFRYGTNPTPADPNTYARSATNFCAGIVGGSLDSTGNIDAGANAMEAYGTSVLLAETEQSCPNTGDLSPPPSAPPYNRISNTNTGLEIKEAAIAACAESLQYGLLNQERLFGIPDPISNFVADARPEVGGHAVAYSFINAWWYDAIRPSRFHDPIWRLEAYMAFRLAMTTYWGMLVGSVIGYFAARAFVPLFVTTFSQIGCIRTYTGETVVIVRPKFELPIFLAALGGFATAWWLVFVDPGTQSHYPITTDCAEWSSPNPQSSSGAYVTTWTRPRSTRLPPGALGPFVAAVSILPMFMFFLNIAFDLRNRGKFKDYQNKYFARVGIFAFFVLLVMAGLAQGAVALQSEESGRAWHDLAKGGDSTTEAVNRYCADCQVAVYTSFWTGAVVGWARTRWTLNGIADWWKYLWMVGAIVILFMPVIQARALIGEELFDDSLNEDAADRTRHNYLVFLFFPAIVIMLILIIILTFSITGVRGGKSEADPAQQLEEAKRAVDTESDAANIFLSPEVQRLMDHKVLEHMPVHDAVGHPTGAATLAERAYGAFRVSNTGGVGYRPFLRATRALKFEPLP